MSEEILKRVQIAKNAIMSVRTEEANRHQQVLLRKEGTSVRFDEYGSEQKYPLVAYGAVGLLRFIETGDIDEIKEKRLKHEVLDQYGRQ